DELIAHYKTSMENLAKAGIKVITYNFMPLLDWLRTDVAYVNEDGGEILYFKKDDYSIFDLFILQRPGAENEYDKEELLRLRSYYDNLSQSYTDKLTDSFLLPLPGDEAAFSLDRLREKIEEYRSRKEEDMRQNMLYFLHAVCPLADELSLKMAVHPDDPPFSVFGLPRIVSTEADCQYIFTHADYPSNGLCFCTGSLGARADNNLPEMIKQLGPRIFFLHLRNTRRLPNGDFFEANHLEGSTDMYAVIQNIVQRMNVENRSVPMRPDHGPKILDDRNKETYPGYTAIGRLKGLAEVRGLEYGIIRQMKENKQQ